MLRTMKPLGAVLLALVLTACAGTDAVEETTEAPAQPAPAPSTEVATPTPTPTPTPAPAPTPTATAPAPEPEITTTPEEIVESFESGENDHMGTMAYFEEEVGDRVYFAYDSHALTEAAHLTLERQVVWLELFPAVNLLVEGHCDERGTREYNIALGARRAAAVKDFLIGSGVSPTRVETVSFGKERPVATCSEESCWSRNRRGVSRLLNAPAS